MARHDPALISAPCKHSIVVPLHLNVDIRGMISLPRLLGCDNIVTFHAFAPSLG